MARLVCLFAASKQLFKTKQLLSLLIALTVIVPAYHSSAGQQTPPKGSPAATPSRSAAVEQDGAAGEKPWDDVTLGVKKFWADRTRSGPVPPNAYEKAKKLQWDKLPKASGAMKGKAGPMASPSSSCMTTARRRLAPRCALGRSSRLAGIRSQSATRN